MNNRWYGRAYAKINLGLSILGKLPNGFHRVKTIYSQIHLWDEIEMVSTQFGTTIECADKTIPTDETNLVFLATELIRKKMGKLGGITIRLNKRIPVGAGLGGGSSDAATVLRGLNEWWKLGLSKIELISLATQIGSDVAYQLVGGVKMEIQGGDEKGIMTDLGKLPPCFIVVAVPQLCMSSQKAYASVPQDMVGQDHVEALVQAIQKRELSTICKAMQNDFEQWVLKQYPILDQLKSDMKKSGALIALLSGKGAAVFGVFGDRDSAEKAEGELKKNHSQVWLTEPIYPGEQL